MVGNAPGVDGRGHAFAATHRGGGFFLLLIDVHLLHLSAGLVGHLSIFSGVVERRCCACASCKRKRQTRECSFWARRGSSKRGEGSSSQVAFAGQSQRYHTSHTSNQIKYDKNRGEDEKNKKAAAFFAFFFTGSITVQYPLIPYCKYRFSLSAHGRAHRHIVTSRHPSHPPAPPPATRLLPVSSFFFLYGNQSESTAWQTTSCCRSIGSPLIISELGRFVELYYIVSIFYFILLI